MVGIADGTGDFFDDPGGCGFSSTDEDVVDDGDAFYNVEDVGGPTLGAGQDIDTISSGTRTANLVRNETTRSGRRSE